MKLVYVSIMVLLFISALSSSDRLYMEFGPDFGVIKKAYYDGKDIHDLFKESEEKYCIDFGGKVGYVLKDNKFILTCQYNHTTINFKIKNDEVFWLNNRVFHYIAPGITFYPNKRVQVSTSIGRSFGKGNAEYEDYSYGEKLRYHISGNMGFDISAAYDLKLKHQHGILLGIRYFTSNHEFGAYDLDVHTLSLFLKFRYIGVYK